MSPASPIQPPAPPAGPTGPALRSLLRARRAALPPAARHAATRAILRVLARSPWLRPGTRLGLYFAAGSEVPTAELLRLALRRGARVYLPRISDPLGARMQLLRWRGGRLRRNRFGIGEPVGGQALPVQSLDVLLLPLVGFDANGSRLGSGAGYYDRLLAGRLGRQGKPLLVGLAFEAQRWPRLERAGHDVPLDALVSERGWHSL